VLTLGATMLEIKMKGLDTIEGVLGLIAGLGILGAITLIIVGVCITRIPDGTRELLRRLGGAIGFLTIVLLQLCSLMRSQQPLDHGKGWIIFGVTTVFAIIIFLFLWRTRKHKR
jgi:hypothetical protein